MKYIINNKYVKTFKFSSYKEAAYFLGNQKPDKILSLDETFGDSYFCYVCHHSLTRQKQFVISFSSDVNEESLNFLFWTDHDKIVLDTGKLIYLIDIDLKIIASFDITTPLIGLYQLDKNRLLLLEEAFLRVIDHEGKILRSELFDLAEDFSIEDCQLSIQTRDDRKTFNLSASA